MKVLNFDNAAELGALMHEAATEDHCDVTAVLFYDRAQELIKKLLGYDGVKIGKMDFCDESYDYDREYYVTLDFESELIVEPAYSFKNDGYRRAECYRETVDGLFIDGDASSKILSANEGVLMFEVEFDEKKDETAAVSGVISDLLEFLKALL